MGSYQGLPPHGASWPQRSDYDPYSYAYSHHSAAAASYYLQPPASAASSWSSAAGASNNVVVGGPGANPLTVSALSQPTSFAASIGDVGHLPYYDPQYPPAQHPTAVGGIGTLTGVSRGRGPSHGGGRGGSPMYHPLIWDAGVTSPCGRGRGRGQGRGRGCGSKSSDRQLDIRASSGSSASEAQPETVCAPAHVVQATTTNSSRGTVVPAAWCDICRVGCNSKEILEQHKNGKRHKRAVQRMHDMACPQGVTLAIADMGAPSSTSSQLAGEERPFTAVHMVPPLGSTSLGGEHKDLAPENVVASVSGVQITGVTRSSSKQNTTHHTAAVGHSVGAQVELHVAVQACQPSNEMKDGGEAPPNAMGPSNVQLVEAKIDVNSNKNGPKRKLTGVGHGGKKLRVSQAPQQRQPERVREQPLVCTICNVTCDTRVVFAFHLGGKKHRSRLERSQAPQQRRPERVREQPLVCTICNVTCDTRVVFAFHLGGKKHQSRLERSQGPDMFFGPLVAHIPPNQSAAHMTGAPEPLYYGFKSKETLLVEQEAYLAGTMQHAFPILPQAGPTIMAADYPAQPATVAIGAASKGKPVTASLRAAAGDAEVK